MARLTIPLTVALFAFLALLPAAAQTPTPQPPQIQIKIEFATISSADLDNLGINFDVFPFTVPIEGPAASGPKSLRMYLTVQSGDLIARLYQTLIRTHDKVVSLPTVTTSDSVATTLPVDAQVPFLVTQVVFVAIHNAPLPQSPGNVHVRGKMTILMHNVSGNQVTLAMQPQVTVTAPSADKAAPLIPSKGIPFVVRTVSSGETMVISGSFLEVKTSPAPGLLKPHDFTNQELLIFLTPTIIGESNDHNRADANGGQSVTVTP